MSKPTLLAVLELACIGRAPRGPAHRDLQVQKRPKAEDSDTYRRDPAFCASGLRRRLRRQWSACAPAQREG